TDTGALRKLVRSGPEVNIFFSNAVIREALNNPAIINAVAASKLAEAIVSTPAVKSFMNDPAALKYIIAANPLISSLCANKTLMNALSANPATGRAAARLMPPDQSVK
ncbi:MAG: hypothetical protein ABIG11_03210, partial [bacterium]